MRPGPGRRALGAGLAILGLTLLGGCGNPKRVVKLDNYIITWYFSPRFPVVGENQVALRIQDRDYRILNPATGSLNVAARAGREDQRVILKPGPGRDLRGWVQFQQPGEHQLRFSFLSARGQTVTAEFLVPVSGPGQ